MAPGAHKVKISIMAPPQAAQGAGLSAITPAQKPCCDGLTGVAASIPGAVVTQPACTIRTGDDGEHPQGGKSCIEIQQHKSATQGTPNECSCRWAHNAPFRGWGLPAAGLQIISCPATSCFSRWLLLVLYLFSFFNGLKYCI